ncbi:MAG: glycine cleavage system aminomethyltransferase GcvT, partial [Clostridia bacterium]|nr:glycine cleavage system aminomethyltransferase GcvT [Clostridia bacterium]
MGELKRTQLFDVHVNSGATMVDFGGWEMPVQYPTGIVAEHLYTRHACSLFDVSHMGRLLIEGPDRIKFLQHVVSSNVMGLDLNKAQYCIIPDEDGSAVDDAYLYSYEEDNLLLVVNASNTDKDLAHFEKYLKDFDCTIKNITADYASIAVQGPKSKDMLTALAGGQTLTEPMKNALNTLMMEGREVRVAKTGYTGEPLGYEVFVKSEDAEWMWNRLIELGAKPAGLGARDTLRLEAGMPLYGHEMGVDPDGNRMPIYAVPLARFAVSFSPQKGNFVGREPLAAQYEAFKRINNRDFSDITAVPRRIMPITLLDKGVMRAGMTVYQGGKQVGWVTSGTMVPYYVAEGEGLQTVILEETAKRAIGMCYINSDILEDDTVEVDVRGKRLKAVIPPYHMRVDAPPFARPILYRAKAEAKAAAAEDRLPKAITLLNKALENHRWRQQRCINLIPSENTPSRAVQMLGASDPAFRYAEHKKVKSFYDADIFYYQGTKFID